MVGPNGLEPSTSSVSGRRSNQLSYGPACLRLRFNSNGRRVIPATLVGGCVFSEQRELRNALECELGPRRRL
jgi:hypothetical protein